MDQLPLKHREMDDAILKLAAGQTCASDTFKRGSMLAKVAQSLLLGLKCRLETADLPKRADRQRERDGPALT
jgi:hypothetical protein